MFSHLKISSDPSFLHHLNKYAVIYLINCKDDVLKVLIHLGYLSYDGNSQECYIPNKEVSGEMVNAVNPNGWSIVSNAIKESEALLNATLRATRKP